MVIDKIIVSNKTALRRKYGKHFSLVEKALKQLVAHDKTNGLVSKIIWLDDVSSMKSFKTKPITDHKRAEQYKKAIDALYRKIDPDYILLFGADDVIPHIRLRNMIAASRDEDRIVPSDLPYASDNPYSTRIIDFKAPSRVLSRLPDLENGSDPAYPIALIKHIINWKKKLPAEEYKSYFAISAKVWKGSTGSSIKKMFETTDNLLVSPEALGPYPDEQMDKLVHFFNCHGGKGSPIFEGDDGTPSAFEAIRSSHINTIRHGCLAVAECCYSSDLYDPEYANGEMGICNKYLLQGALAFLGSTTIAWGPPDGQELADLITQYFVINIQKGASVGRAMLDARLRFVQKSAPRLGPYELKTLAQFTLLGDPSVHLVEPPAQAANLAAGKGKSAAAESLYRYDRRANFEHWSRQLSDYCVNLHSKKEKRTRVLKAIQQELRAQKFNAESQPLVFGFTKSGWQKQSKSEGEQYHIYFEKGKAREKDARRKSMLVIREIDGEIVGVTRYEKK